MMPIGKGAGNWIDTDLFERSGKSITNFVNTLPATWEIIKEALRHNTVIRFRYRNNNWDPDLEQKIIHLRPYQLLIDEGKNIIYGFMEEKKAIRLFYLSNMYEISDTKKKFELPADFDFKNH
ncbi:MAG: WYL domain-containing protein [Treponema sp.]|nr:WYL domain-containing protein [Treponema sp.]